MNRATISLVRLATAIVVAAAGCSSKVCTEVGCQDQFSARITAATAFFPSGAHTVTVTADGVSLSCTFQYPAPALSGGGAVAPACSPGLLMGVGPATVCTEVRHENAVELRCEPVPGQLVETISVFGTPANVRLQQSAGGALLVDHSASPAYATVRPNGPECDPVCHQAAIELALP